MELRRYTSEDLQAVAELFRDCVLKVNVKDYTPTQVSAWSSRWEDLLRRDTWFLSMYTVLAFEKGRLVGYGNVSGTGYVDHLFTAWDFQGRGVASAVLAALQSRCLDLGLDEMSVHASITAKGFFERWGFHVVKEQQVTLLDTLFTNYAMVKSLPPSGDSR